MTNPVLEALEQRFEHKKVTDHQAMSMASVAAYVQNQSDMIRSGRRHEAQADAILKVKYSECGYPDAYQPPEPPEDEDMATMINCTFNGDKTISDITQAMSKVSNNESDETEKPSEPVEPKEPVVVLPPPPKGSNVPKWLLSLAGIAIGAGLTFGAAQYFGGDDKDTQNVYDAVAIPYFPQAEPAPK
jgi:hypothetical protein